MQKPVMLSSTAATSKQSLAPPRSHYGLSNPSILHQQAVHQRNGAAHPFTNIPNNSHVLASGIHVGSSPGTSSYSPTVSSVLPISKGSGQGHSLPFVSNRTYENPNRIQAMATTETASVGTVLVRAEPAESTVRSDSTPPPSQQLVHRDGEMVVKHQLDTIMPPFGWKRILTNGIIVYISPSNTALSSTEAVKTYLSSEGTCKCGLECPVNCDVVFNFNPKVLTRPWTAPAGAPGDLTKLCNHKRKLLATLDSMESRYDGFRRKKRRVAIPPTSVSQLLSQREPTSKEPEIQNGLPWKDCGAESVANGVRERSLLVGTASNSTIAGLRLVETASSSLAGTSQLAPSQVVSQYQRLEEPRFPATPVTAIEMPAHVFQPRTQQGPVEQLRLPYQAYELKLAKAPSRVGPPAQELAGSPVVVPQGITVNRTPPWQQNKVPAPAGSAVQERVPPLHNHANLPASALWTLDSRKALTKVSRRRSEDVHNPADALRGPSSSEQQPSFMDDPSGYLARQTALLNSTISRQNVNSPLIEGLPLAGSISRYNAARPKSRQPDSSIERKKFEEPSSTDVDCSPDDRGPIQGATISTSNRRDPVEAVITAGGRSGGTESILTIVTTMASGHTASSNTITSVLAGRANTATVTTNNQIGLQKPPQVETPPSSSRTSSQGSAMAPSPAPAPLQDTNLDNHGKSGNGQQQHILVSNCGQLIVTNSSMLSPQQLHQQGNAQKIATSSPQATSQISVSSQVLNHQPTVLVNALPGPLLLQPNVAMVDGINTVQLPQIVGNVVQNQVVDDGAMLSPDSKRKLASVKRRKLSPTANNAAMLLSPPGTSNMAVQQQSQQQPLNTPMLQALTILPSKTNFPNTQQLITANMLQPLNLVQNFPIQQFIVPAGVSGMVMSDGTILQDAVQLNVLTPVQNSSVFGNGQNLIAPGMVIRTPSNESAGKVLQNNQFLSSPNQFVVNNTFSSQLSPLLSVSPTQGNRNQDYMPQNVVVQQQPNTSNTTVLQQNTTIVQQTTTVSNQQTQPSSTLNLNQNFILNEKQNFILAPDKQNFILGPNNEKIILNDNGQGSYVLGNVDKQNFLINNVDDKQNLMVDNFDKPGPARGVDAATHSLFVDRKNSVSTQTQNNQVLQIASSPGLVVATNSAVYNTSSSSCFSSGSPPDTTTLSPIDQEVTTSCFQQRTDSPLSADSAALPMVHCISSSSQQEDSSPFSLDSYSCVVGKSYPETNVHMRRENDEYDRKPSLCDVPDSLLLPNGDSDNGFIQEQ
ncbi:methyl-CpG Hypothetical protein domain protein 5 [Nesidiocoris tenuis]|uniref:MBD domain-containing protein n=1 Tax=Nesidiocoris tenuis TaxID=355587 RepID=A0ABN7AXK3_9HEMI|nr:methyl-CpG Hypothetical protein domain protein 5 [Nesidiocoris tenuis]